MLPGSPSLLPIHIPITLLVKPFGVPFPLIQFPQLPCNLEASPNYIGSTAGINPSSHDIFQSQSGASQSVSSVSSSQQQQSLVDHPRGLLRQPAATLPLHSPSLLSLSILPCYSPSLFSLATLPLYSPFPTPVLCFSSLCKCMCSVLIHGAPQYTIDNNLTSGAQLSSTPRPTTTLDRTNQLDT